jgi:hypothetical protein
MTDQRLELELLLTRLRGRREELLTKIERTRELLTRADSRRAAEPDQKAKWDATLNNLEASYDVLKREYELAKMETERVERELTVIDGGQDVSLDTMIRRAEQQDTATVSADAAKDSGTAFAGRGLIRVMSTPIGRLARLNVDQLRRLAVVAAASEGFTAEEKSAVTARINLAIEATGASHPEAPEAALSARRQFVLRAAVDKIQRRMAHDLTPDETEALLTCHARLQKSTSRTPSEARLLAIITEVISVIRRR